MSFCTEDRIINLLIDLNEIINPDRILSGSQDSLQPSDAAVLIFMPSNMVWTISAVDTTTGILTSVVVFDAKTVNRITSGKV